jgi:hypothetical protein
MLYNHSEQINICLQKKLDEAVLTNTYTKSNDTIKLQYHPYEPCSLMDEDYTVQAKSDIPLYNYNSRRALYSPVTVTFKTEIRYDHLIRLKERLLGETGTDEDYGTIGWPDYNGLWWEGYIWEMDYDPASKLTAITARVKGKIL